MASYYYVRVVHILSGQQELDLDAMCSTSPYYIQEEETCRLSLVELHRQQQQLVPSPPGNGENKGGKM